LSRSKSAQEAIVTDPVGSAVQVDHGGEVHGDHAGQLLAVTWTACSIR
jgi:hypothetical protein